MESGLYSVLGLVFALVIPPTVNCVCYFPSEYIGTYLIQTQTEVHGHLTASFSEVTFELDSIPPWGKCYKRRGDNIILKDSSGGDDCMRCFYLSMKTPNVIQIHTEGLGRCYTKEEAVIATCPDERAIYERKFKEIMLYRKQEPVNALVPEPLFCPIGGKFRFTYTAANGELRCDQSMSELANCPLGSTLEVRFRQCSFPDFDVNFRCLGDWDGPNNDRFLALMDLRDNGQDKPKFRCGMYRVDLLSGRVLVSLSADSTCHSQLRSPTDGYESMILTPYPEKSPPYPAPHTHCRFPEWVQGHWEGIHISGHTLMYKDRSRLQRISLTCLRREHDSPADQFIVFSSTHCGEESYNCVWLKKRSENVMEFQIGLQPSEKFSDVLCNDLQFSEEQWIAQGRLKAVQIFPCPITGDYTGVLPKSSGLCAKVASDCNNPDVMFYTVSNCENRSQIYEESEYRCLGSWEDSDGVTYTYTQRREMGGYQCFSGKVLHNGKEAYIKEAGHTCIRGEDPFIYGMKISKHASCPQTDHLSPFAPKYSPSGRDNEGNQLSFSKSLDPKGGKNGSDQPNINGPDLPAGIPPDASNSAQSLHTFCMSLMLGLCGISCYFMFLNFPR